MEVKMDQTTYEYVKKKGGKISIDLMIPKGCCGGSMIPNIIFNHPPEKKMFKFHKLTYEDLEIYVDKVMDFRDNMVELKLKKKMLIKDIELPTLQLL
ncbi:CC/Se motif family (seleno)protein [Tindallia californiensis]|uniref:Fe-S cluster assembly iron-binding protein IscA n=1 Tax=Tindallia californiensis TaxID=159292 RepID=A0A1H3INW7_9FIRM|nr:CC/Se motif family (seleno)protein [Tindallia californiensis]SDY28514.1 hypothetical protein SAMN05192546_101201 [Tindallia californiensis]